MQSQDSQKIVNRFFEALHILKTCGMIRGVKTFTDRYGINRRNLYQLERNPEKDILQLAWLAYLIVDYNISAMWLLTGEGDVFRTEMEEPVNCREQK